MRRRPGCRALLRVRAGHAVRGASRPPGAGPSNLYIAAGKRSREALLAAFPEAVLVTDEQSASFMADGYARSTGKVGTYIVVPGPGGLPFTQAMAAEHPLLKEKATALKAAIDKLPF